jgi:hypothetical protein
MDKTQRQFGVMSGQEVLDDSIEKVYTYNKASYFLVIINDRPRNKISCFLGDSFQVGRVNIVL